MPSLNRSQRELLALIAQRPGISNEALYHATEIGYRRLPSLLHALREAGHVTLTTATDPGNGTQTRRWWPQEAP